MYLQNPMLHVPYRVHPFRHCPVMCRDDERGLGALKRSQENIEQMLPCRMIELARRFIRQKKFWLRSQGAGYSDTLSLSSRKFFGQFLSDRAQPYAIKRIKRSSSRFLCTILSKQQGNLHVLYDRKRG
jgi:hypothetical protein